ncbi:DUF411 domain-containing protein [Jiella sonneratiae]|uniref:DUF411 domain-containing protein n=1 Tax=Jiella sonneratiae TaxID=2816856 RepID=A0ABS3J232_9HYPH|nr:DUF411 domain-containing protein [Jiella sonneratiae]MBO0903717.1 DUF411 domain-containing protein [Jiella sonneratiae]
MAGLTRRRAIGLGLVGSALFGLTISGRAAEAMTVYASPSCGCCHGWVEHMRAAGFAVVVEDRSSDELARIKRAAGLPPALSSCHTARIGGYVVEGHVPAAEVARLLKERPEAIGLTVPGMPADAPGMGHGDTPFAVLLVRPDGEAERFAAYPR